MREVGQTLVTLGVQTLEVAVRAEQITEILGERAWVALPGSRNEIPGVLVWAGRAVAVLDLARFHPGLGTLAAGESRARTVIVESAGSTIAVPTDRVSEVWKTHEDDLKPRQLTEFELARLEVVSDDGLYALFEPELLLERLGVEV